MRGAGRKGSRAACALLLAAGLLTLLLAGPAKAGQGLSDLLYALLTPQAQTAAESAVILPAAVQAMAPTAAESAVLLPGRSEAPQEEPGQNALSPSPAPEMPKVPEDYVPEITNHTSYSVNAAALFGAAVPALVCDGTPEILIVHTHSSESFQPDADDPYLPSDGMRTLDTKYNVVRLGDELAEMLEAAGIGVVHDREINDYPSYNGAYSQMRRRIERYLAEAPTIRIVLDIHRDAILDEKGRHLALLTQTDGADTARVMLVVGTDEGGLTHHNWRENLAFAAALQGWGDTLWPGLMRPIDLRRERFNQHETAGSLIVEIGSSGNTLAQARRGLACFAQILLAALGCA